MKSCLVVGCLALSLFAGCGNRELIVAQGGRARCRIVMDGDAPNDVRFATHDLTNHLERMTGAAFAIVTAPPADGTPSIECGTDRARQAALVTAGTLADGEAAVVCDGKDILIWGAGANGTSNGIYAFLERKLGCRWLTPWDEPFIPSRRDLRLEPFTLVYRPRLKVRWLLTALGSASQAKNGALFLYRNRENVNDQPGFGSNYDRPEGCTILKHDRYSVAPSVHTMFYYLPPADKDGRKGYFKDHPDWYSLNRKGVRTDKMQVCFSNPDACATFASNFFARVEKGGGRGYFNISQTDDDGDGFCHCADCEACVKKYGTPGAPFFVFLKRTAEELARRFPDAAITFLCYRKTQTQYAPNAAFGRFPDNLVPVFAPIDDNFSKDFAHPDNAATFEDFKKWCAVAANVWTWYYPLPYGGLNAPAGGIGRWVRDLRRLADAGLTGAMFEHDVGYPMGFNTVDLQAWMILKCYENPDFEVDRMLRDFCSHYYGPAAKEVIAYVKALDEIADTCTHRLAWNDWYPEAIQPAALLRWHALFDAAEEKVRGDALLLQRVRECRTGVDLHTLRTYAKAARGGFALSADELYGRITNTLERAYDRRAEQRFRASKWCVPRRIYERAMANARSWHAVAAAGQKLPPPLENVRAEEVLQIVGGNCSGGKGVALPDAFAGVAVWNQKDSTRPGSFTCGYYDKVAKKVVASKSFTDADIVPDRFQLYRIGTVRLAARGLVYLGGSWLCTQDMQEFYDASEPDRKWDLWISYKFEGPRFKGSVAKENRVLYDRMILVPAGGSR